jgi:hypothetical protein
MSYFSFIDKNLDKIEEAFNIFGFLTNIDLNIIKNLCYYIIFSE